MINPLKSNVLSRKKKAAVDAEIVQMAVEEDEVAMAMAMDMVLQPEVEVVTDTVVATVPEDMADTHQRMEEGDTVDTEGTVPHRVLEDMVIHRHHMVEKVLMRVDQVAMAEDTVIEVMVENRVVMEATLLRHMVEDTVDLEEKEMILVVEVQGKAGRMPNSIIALDRMVVPIDTVRINRINYYISPTEPSPAPSCSCEGCVSSSASDGSPGATSPGPSWWPFCAEHSCGGA